MSRSRGPCARAPTGARRDVACLADRRKPELRGPFSFTRLWRAGLLPAPRGKTNAFRELLLFELAAHGIVRRAGEIRHAVHEAKRKQDCRIVADVDASIAF